MQFEDFGMSRPLENGAVSRGINYSYAMRRIPHKGVHSHYRSVTGWQQEGRVLSQGDEGKGRTYQLGLN